MPQPPLPPEHDENERLAALARDARTSDSAFDLLARTVRRLVVRWARSVTGDQDEAEDVAQLVLLRLRDKGERLDGSGALTSWLYRVTRNITLDRQRTARRRRLLLHAARHDARIVDNPNANPDAASPPLATIVSAFLDELTPRQQAVVELIDLRGLQTAQVAKQLGISASTVRVLLAQGRRRLRLRLLEAHPDLLQEYRP